MTALPRPGAQRDRALRVIPGRRRRRATVGPWSIVALIAIVAFLGLGLARTSLDRSAFELTELDAAIRAQESLNNDLRLEIARLESPARIAPLAEELGMVAPDETRPLVVESPGRLVSAGGPGQ